MSTSRRPDQPNLGSARLLVELVNQTLDPGYAAAAARRSPGARPSRFERPMVAIGCLLIGLLLVVAYVHTHRSAPEAARVHDSLVDRVRSVQRSGNELEKRVGGLEVELSKAQHRALPDSGALGVGLDRARLTAGAVAVHGPGLTVTLREPPTPSGTPAPGRGGTTSIGATHILTDRDVRSVVNELWHDGAEAIAVNGVRVTATTAIRFAGEAVLVDFQPITSPYRIEALGESDVLATNFAQSSVASRYQTLTGVEHIGFEFDEADRVELPAGPPVTLHYAVPAKRGSR